MTLIGSTVLWGGREYLVLAIRPEGCLLHREGAEDRLLSQPATWRAYDAMTAALAAEDRAERLDVAPARPGRWTS